MTGSLALHGLLFAWLLHAPEPRLLMPQLAAHGSNGKVLTGLYWPTLSPDDSTTTSPPHATEVYRHQRSGHEKIIWKPTKTLQKMPQPPSTFPASAVEDNSSTATLSNLGHGATAGRLYSSLPGGPLYDDEVRPALPVATADPVIYPWERPASEGKVVIEITIDEKGEIVRKTVLQSLGSAIDNKCLAALENWHFRPATHNGAPIPSKQDAIFPFKARG